MITFMYRWKIPQDMKEEFLNNWIELTEQVRNTYGMHTANLYVSGDDFVSITLWEDELSWEHWVQQLKNHPYRNRWREYRVAGPEKLEIVSRIGEEISGA
jgi:heme-degrading monooxygenase HmoA